MEDSKGNHVNGASKDRGFVCGCGKAYLSNAALFTHVKQKHNGKPPEGIQKPNTLYSRRGRPSTTMIKQKKVELQRLGQVPGLASAANGLNPDSHSVQKFEEIYEYLKEIQENESIDPSIWTKVEAFQLLYEYIQPKESNRPNSEFRYAGVRMGEGLAEFLRNISDNVKAMDKFQQVVVLFALTLQYVFDQNDSKSIMHEAPVEFIMEYVNLFIDFQLKNVARDFDIQHLWITKRQNTVKVFYCFYHWLVSKKYTQYKVSLSSQIDYEDFSL